METTTTTTKRNSFKLGPRTDIPGSEQDPPNMAELVAGLQELGFGFSSEDCEKALRMSSYNSDLASDYLLRGKVPNTPNENQSSVPRGPNNLTKEQTELVHKLAAEYHKEYSTAMQVFVLVDFDEEQARSILANMK